MIRHEMMRSCWSTLQVLYTNAGDLFGVCYEGSDGFIFKFNDLYIDQDINEGDTLLELCGVQYVYGEIDLVYYYCVLRTLDMGELLFIPQSSS
ncbi:MAG: hypothetical protein EZS28_013392 [Streblomastix strix]|uniref:Uncharacterized protein n=1 Tax=Streblomastix strix TaxID=222440 RepID=A0A5J4W9N8_9EUKA|nr:MAG: hypothetical protein EZS28_013392 [Streblomastix strix]